MVMDATPSPQSVGREFVRQYYTLLNKAPHHLHRFYNHQSSFVHGGLEPANSTRDCLVIGQKQIHNKIQQLNFRDCHAKISQVDAQATLGNGVVVQVTGELSNDGQPMRRFTQTFVLAAQAPKKYYVHNDIFRYQDVVWDEDQQQQPDSGEQDSDARSEEVNDADPAVGGGAGDVVVQAAAVELQQQHVGVVNMQQQQQPNQVEAVQQQQQFYNHTAAVKPAPGIFPSSAPSSTLPVVNGTAATTQASVAAPAVDNEQVHRVPVQQQQPAVVSQAIQSETTAENSKPVVVDEVVKVPAAAAEKKEQRIAAEVPFKPPQPETFASLVKSGGGPGGRVISSTRGPAAPVAIQSVSVVSSGGGGAGGRGERDQPREQQSNQNSSNSNSSNQNLGGGGGGPRERRSSTNNNGGPREQYGDSQQLFVGNIPHHATEDELKAMFGKYGVVIDLRIFTKQSQALPSGGKGSTGRVPQNYGFVTFRESESAQAVLANPNICFPEDSPDGQKLNIEEKMQRVGDRDRRSMGGGMNGGMGNGGGSRGMGRGGGGGGMQGSGMMRNSGPRGSGGGGDGRNGTGPRGGGGGGGGGSYNRSQIIRNGSAGSGLTSSGGASGGGGGGGSGNTYSGRR